jgi:hypothetical protein
MDLNRAWQVAQESLDLVVQPIERFELAGKLNDDPARVRTGRAKEPFPAIFALAVAAATAPEPLRSRSLATAAQALLSWARVYRPTGNPVDEWFFLPVLQAIDLVAGFVEPAASAVLLNWANEFASSGDRFYRRIAPRNKARANNWMSRRLVIRAVGSTVAGDQAARAAIPAMVRDYVERAFVAGPSGQRDGCTFDFVQRDALLYHMAGLRPLVEMTLFTPDLMDQLPARAATRSGLEFLAPYFLGEREHIEFARTSISFDRDRGDAGYPEFQHQPWNPDRGRVLLRLARAAFPEIRSWTEHIVDHRYDPRTKLLAAIYGEPQRRAGWPGAGAVSA